jgi:hypothetical protein
MDKWGLDESFIIKVSGAQLRRMAVSFYKNSRETIYNDN